MSHWCINKLLFLPNLVIDAIPCLIFLQQVYLRLTWFLINLAARVYREWISNEEFII